MTVNTVLTSKFYTGGGSSPITWTHDADFTAGSDVLVYFNANDFDTGLSRVTGVTVNGVTAVRDLLKDGSTYNVEIWRATNVPGGGADVAIAHNAGGIWIVGCIHEVTGISGSTVTSVTLFNNNAADPDTISTSTGSPAVGDLLIFSTGGATNSALDSSLTISYDSVTIPAGIPGYGAHKLVGTAGNQTITYTDGTANQNIGVIVYEAAAVAVASSATDSVTATDAATTASVVAASTSDAVTATDSASTTAVYLRSATDSVTATDAATTTTGVTQAVAADSVAATDSASASGSVFYCDASDSISATDVVVLHALVALPGAGEVWNYVLKNGLTAEENMMILVAVAAGKTTITPHGPGEHQATVTFRQTDDSQDVVVAEMDGSERVSTTLTPGGGGAGSPGSGSAEPDVDVVYDDTGRALFDQLGLTILV